MPISGRTMAPTRPGPVELKQAVRKTLSGDRNPDVVAPTDPWRFTPTRWEVKSVHRCCRSPIPNRITIHPALLK